MNDDREGARAQFVPLIIAGQPILKSLLVMDGFHWLLPGTNPGINMYHS